MASKHCANCKWEVDGYCHSLPPGSLIRVIRDEDHKDLRNFPQVDPDLDGPCIYFKAKTP